MNFCIFKSAFFLTQITRFEKNTLTSSRKKNFWSFSCFFGKFHWYLIWRLQLWILVKFFWFILGKVKGYLLIWDDLCRKSQRISRENLLIYIWKVWVFWSISIDLYEKSKRILSKLVNLYRKYERILTNISQFETLKAKGL